MSEANTQQPDIIGRARADGQRIIRDWFEELMKAENNNEPTCYVFVIAGVGEILNAFGIHMFFPEIGALQSAVRKQSLDYINLAEDYGFSPDVCGYVKADVGFHLSGMKHPMGQIPKPKLVIAPNLCNTYVKWAEIWERWYNVPVFVLDIPGMRGTGWYREPNSEDFQADVRYVKAQLEEIIELCEKVTGKKFKMDWLAEAEHQVNIMGEAWAKTINLNQNVPAPFNAMADGLTYLGMVNILRGKVEGAKYFTDLLEETEEKVRLGIGALPNEKYRLVFSGTACYPKFRRFTDLFESWGAAFTHSDYLGYAGGALSNGISYDTSRPLDSLAEQLVYTTQRAASNMFFSEDQFAQWFKEWKADGVVYHAVKSCRTVSTGMADNRLNLIRKHNIPCLMIESDLVDPRVWSEAQIKNRIDAFFESLESRRAREGKAS